MDWDPESDRDRLDAEWVTLNALRELLTIASKGQTAQPSYAQAIALGRELAPEIYNPETSLIERAHEPPLAREFRQKADALSKMQGRQVDPVDLLTVEIAQYEKLLEVEGRRDELVKTQTRMVRARDYLKGEVLSEHKILQHDVFVANRPELPEPSETTTRFREYRLEDGRALRIRLLHPDRAEQITGADLVYEVCDPASLRARFSLVQYKIWNGKSLSVPGARNLADQLTRLDTFVCARGLCNWSSKPSPPDHFRLPPCAAFLRPTDALQWPGQKLVSRGLHVPTCIVKEIRSRRGKGPDVLRKRDLHGRSLSSRSFEELFNRGLLGSEWMSYKSLEDLYHAGGILAAHERVVLHAQEYTVA